MSANILVVTENMPYEDWLEWRKKGIGGLGAPLGCGGSPHKNPGGVWVGKR